MSTKNTSQHKKAKSNQTHKAGNLCMLLHWKHMN